MVAPTIVHAFFEQAEFERLFCHDLFQITGFTAQIFDLIGVSRTGCTARQPLRTNLHEVLRPLVIDALWDAFAAAQLSNSVLAARPIQHDPDLLFGREMFAGRSLDVFEDLLARALRCLSHRPLIGGHDEQQKLS